MCLSSVDAYWATARVAPTIDEAIAEAVYGRGEACALLGDLQCAGVIDRPAG